uniref:G_PROTEIN_RECEP_F1_2 domain-containing protein n=1 Tax=Globodera pallida TaxID=36090 RepID=A0A183BT35_GLOPA
MDRKFIVKQLSSTWELHGNFAIISLTVERFFAIVYPLQHLRFSGLNRWKVICAWLFPLMLFSFNHLFALRRTAHDFASIQFSTSKAFKCNYDTESRYVDILFHFPRILFQFVLTFVVVLGVNTFIFIKLRSRYVIIGETGPGEMRSTNVLLAVVPVIYIVLNFLYSLKNFLKFFQTNKGSYFFLEQHYWFVILSYILFCLNFAINFIVYAMIRILSQMASKTSDLSTKVDKHNDKC